MRVVPPGVHAERSSRELVLHAAMPPSSWIRLPPSFAFEMPASGALELWLQHADCSTLATGAELEVIAPGKVYMTRGWGEIARVCRTGGALMIHFKYDGTSLMFFKVFDTEGRRLECCAKEGGRGIGVARTRPANRFPSSSLGSSGGAGVSSDSPELLMTRRRATTATSPRARVVLGAGQPHQAAGAADLDGVGAGAWRPTIDDGVFCGDVRS